MTTPLETPRDAPVIPIEPRVSPYAPPMARVEIAEPAASVRRAPRLVLERLDAQGGVTSRARIDALPATIGRTYASDLILDDPYVCPTHVRIFEDESGTLIAEDAGSVNGLRVQTSHSTVSERVSRVVLTPGIELRVGRTTVRCHDLAQPIAATLVDERATPEMHAPRPLRPRLATTTMRAVAITVSVALFMLATFARTVEHVNAASIAGWAIGALAMMAAWAGAWALGGRLARHRAAFLDHLAITSVALTAVLVYGAVNEWLEFLWPSGGPAAVVIIAGGAALGVGLLYSHLGLTSSMTQRKRLAVAAMANGTLVGLVVLFALADQGTFTTAMRFKTQLKPVPARLVPAVSIERFAADARSLRETVDREALENRRARAADR